MDYTVVGPPDLSPVETPAPLDPSSHLTDRFDLSEFSASDDLLEIVDPSAGRPKNVQTIPDRNLAWTTVPPSLIDQHVTNGSPYSDLGPTTSYSPVEAYFDQSAHLDNGTRSYKENFINSDSHAVGLEGGLSHSLPSLGVPQLPRNSPFHSLSPFITGGDESGTTTLPVGQRCLPRRRSKYMIRRQGRQVEPVWISTTSSSPDPLRRWQESPPEDEPAPISAIRNAVQNSSLDHRRGTSDPGCVDAFRTYRQSGSCVGSTTSMESGTSASSRQSAHSGRSGGSNEIGRRRAKNRVQKATNRGRKDKSATTDSPRLFCCTFCCDRFKSKYDWTRHEKSLHLNLENWVCTPFGGAVVLPATGRVHCAYCSVLDPTLEHLTLHNHGACDSQQRRFRRKDHLVQHLRLVHRVETVPLISDWKVETASFTSRCGFCAHLMHSWTERCDHLALHFRAGATMADWHGDHGFPPSIAALVTHAVPPYLIDLESRTLVPFSATNSQAKDHFSQMLSRAAFDQQDSSDLPDFLGQLQMQGSSFNSYTQVLTRHLSHYADEQTRLGVVPTDEMFQREARRLMFDSEDPWNQTIADHPEWLAAFREIQYPSRAVGVMHPLSDVNEAQDPDNRCIDPTFLDK